MPDDDVIAGERVLLRLPRLDDAEELFARVTSDPQVSKHMSWQPHTDIYLVLPNLGREPRDCLLYARALR